MVTQPNYMEGEEFVRKVLAGERNFKGITLPKCFDLNECKNFPEVQAYLRSQNLEENPLYLSHIEWERVKAKGLYLPFVIALQANLRGANLRGANLERANLERADLGEANLGAANLRAAYLRGANLGEANLERADLGEANLGAANLRAAYLREANLGAAYLGGADLRGADLRAAYLGGADLRGANLRAAYLREADLRGARNLETIFNLEYANFGRTRVTEREKTVIEKALEKEPLFVVD